MDYLEIQKRVKELEDSIESAKKELQEIREECDHPEVEYVNYMFRPGRIIANTKVCKYCGQLLGQ